MRKLILGMAMSLAACGGGGGGGGATGSSPPPPPINSAPTVTIGAAPDVTGLEAVKVTATASDSDGTITSTAWRQLSGQAVTFAANVLELSFTAPDVDAATNLQFEFTATDNSAASTTRTITIAVHPTRFYERVSLPFDEGIEQFQSLLASADFTGDGRTDVLAFRFKFNENVRGAVDLFVSSGGTMTSTHRALIDGPALTFFQPRSFEVADFNNDGVADVFIGAHGIDSQPGGEANGLLLSVQGGRLRNASAELPADVGYTHGTASGDIDGDGDRDIVVNNFGGSAPIENNFVLLNDGSGAFTADVDRLPAEMLSGGSYSTIGDSLLVDCDGDDDLDLVVGDHGMGQLARWYRNDGSGDFRNGGFVEIPTPTLGGSLALPTHIQSMDANADGAQDLVFTYYSGGATPFKGGIISVLINDGSGTFSALPPAALPHSVFEVGERDVWVAQLAILDWNGDGRSDIVVANRLLDSYSDATLDAMTPPVWLNNGDLTFRAAPQSILPLVETEGGRTWTTGEVVDIDGDGGRDMFHLGFKWQLLKQVRTYTR